MGSWTLEDIAWDRFDGARVEPDILRIVKAASLVEQNGGDYAQYLCGVFHDDAAFHELAQRWGVEERQHGQALGRWAMLADPQFDHAAAAARFTAGFRVDLDASASVRGSRAGELVARCIVETGTSSYYTALAEATQEPVLKQICQRIAADELRHYKLFYDQMHLSLKRDGLNRLQRLWIGWGRIAESEDDELAYAYFASNEPADAIYDRKRYTEAYARRAYPLYGPSHVQRAMAMILKAVGLKPQGWLNQVMTRAGLWFLRSRTSKLGASGA
jgi:hypothetical protein